MLLGCRPFLNLLCQRNLNVFGIVTCPASMDGWRMVSASVSKLFFMTCHIENDYICIVLSTNLAGGDLEISIWGLEKKITYYIIFISSNYNRKNKYKYFEIYELLNLDKISHEIFSRYLNEKLKMAD